MTHNLPRNPAADTPQVDQLVVPGDPQTGDVQTRAVRIVFAALSTAQHNAFAAGDDELGEALGDLAGELEELTGVEP